MKLTDNIFYKILLSLSISLFIISLSVKSTLAFRQLYYFDMARLGIERDVNLSKDTIKKNYDVLIDYLQDKNIKKLHFPDFKMSKEGEIHFVEVKNLFGYFDYILYVTGVLSLLGIFINLKNKDFSFLKRSAYTLIILPIILAIPFAINFDKSFTVFHKIFFRNDYWEFDPELDPIINVLPQDFFFHNAVLILSIIMLFSVVLWLLHRKLKKAKV